MGHIDIQKVKLLKNEKLEISYKETRDDRSHATISEERDTKPHVDLTNALAALTLHLAILTDYCTVKNCRAAGALDLFVVSGYSIGGKEDEEGVVITGHKLTKSGQSVTLNTPFTRFDQDEKSAYYFIEQLREDLSLIEQEVLSYLDGSKKAPDPQLALSFDGPQEEQVSPETDAEDLMEDEQPDVPIKKKRGRKKKAA